MKNKLPAPSVDQTDAVCPVPQLTYPPQSGQYESNKQYFEKVLSDRSVNVWSTISLSINMFCLAINMRPYIKVFYNCTNEYSGPIALRGASVFLFYNNCFCTNLMFLCTQLFTPNKLETHLHPMKLTHSHLRVVKVSIEVSLCII